MIEHTQTNLEPGNCWQTAVACLLEIEPEALPSQVDHDQRREEQPDGSVRWVGQSYATVLNAYLRSHWDLAYVEVHYPEEIWLVVQVQPPGWHLLTGRTVRTERNHARHVVVGRFGEVVWDPHPSRAGLTTDINHAFLVPFPASWRKTGIGGAVEACVCRLCVTVPDQGVAQDTRTPSDD